MYQAPPVQRLAGEAGAASYPPRPQLRGAVQPAIMGSGITWYDVLGAMPGDEARQIKRKYAGKASLLGPELISGAPPDVIAAVRRARVLLDTAWEVLGDPDSRKRYDEAVGLRRSGGGLGQPGTGIGSAPMAPADPGITGELPGVNVAGGLPGRVGWLGPRRRRSRPGAVPDVRGLFYHVCLEVATRRGLRVSTVRLTERPMAVDGLVVDQDPRPPAKARRGGTLTVQIWHPPARAVAPVGSKRSSPVAASLLRGPDGRR